MENRKQHLEESSHMLELFQTNQPQLSQWLQEKDLMMSVLGPLSMDPNMLNTQKQQVQVGKNAVSAVTSKFMGEKLPLICFSICTYLISLYGHKFLQACM